MSCKGAMVSSSSSLVGLAGQLCSPEDRHQYTRVILQKEQLWMQLEALRSSLQQNYDQHQSKQHNTTKKHVQHQKKASSSLQTQPSSPSSTISQYSSTRHSMSSFSLLFTKSASMYQPQLDEYNTEFLSSHQIDRLSNQYSHSIQQLLQSTTMTLPSPPSSTSSTLSKVSSLSDCPPAPLTVKTTNLSTHHPQKRPHLQQLPISPPISPPFSCSSTSSSTCFSLPPRSSSLQQSTLIGPTKPISPQQEYHAITTMGNDRIASVANSIITHIQKNNGMRIRSFLGQSMVLNKSIRLDQQRLAADSRFYQGKDEYSGKPKVILKLSIVKLSSVVERNKTIAPWMAPFGITFSTSAHAGDSCADFPDSLVVEALHVWMDCSRLPRLSHACHVMREGIRLYIVFDPSVLSQ